MSVIGTALSSMNSSSQIINKSAANIAGGVNPDNLAEDIINIKMASQSYETQLRMIKMSSELFNELINILSESTS